MDSGENALGAFRAVLPGYPAGPDGKEEGLVERAEAVGRPGDLQAALRLREVDGAAALLQLERALLYLAPGLVAVDEMGWGVGFSLMCHFRLHNIILW